MKKAKGKLLVQEYSELLSVGPAVIYTAEVSGAHGATFISENVKEQMGYEPKDFLNDPNFWADHIHPEDRPRVFDELTELFEKGQYILEYRFLHKDGTYYWMRDELRLVHDADGNPEKTKGYWVDITDRKLAEEALRQARNELEARVEERTLQLSNNEERFQEFMEIGSDWLWEMDADLRYSYFTPNYEQHSGVSTENSIGQTRDELYADMLPNFSADEVEQWEKFNQLVKARESFRDYEMKLVGSNGKIQFFATSGKPIFDTDGEFKGYRGVATNLTERKQANEQLSYQASHDSLTGLINRREFEREVERLLSTARRDKIEHAMCFLDLDQFKIINDTCGHIAGDELLRQLGRVLKNVVRNRDTLARLGGDEFGILMEHCTLEQSKRVADTLQQAIRNFQFSWEEQLFRVGGSIGLVAINETTPSLTEIMKQADAACYMAKDLGRNRIHTYHPEDTEIAQRHGEMQWATRISQALEEDRFCLYSQAIVPLGDGSEKHYELLLRMLDVQGKIVPPGAFLPAAERYDLIEQLDTWVITKALALLAANPEFVKQIQFISINLSGPSLTNRDFLGAIILLMKTTGIDASKICFEVTETAAISNFNEAIKFISTLRDLGCSFALDDFGSGLSSFGYLKQLPVDYLKIDGMFVKGIVEDPIDCAMVKSINDVGQVMGMKTIGEFVENDEIKRALKDIGVTYGQGYGIEPPRPFDDLLALA